MTALYTVAYPRLGPQAASFVQAFRKRHDPRCDRIAAHFTLVFRCDGVPQTTYIEHVRSVARTMQAFPFVCRYAMLGSDDEVERAYVFLVPDEGYSGLSLLHDVLYRGPLAAHLRLDLPYVPHITVGASADRALAKRLCDELNAQSFEVAGQIDSLTIAAPAASGVSEVTSFPLGAPQR